VQEALETEPERPGEDERSGEDEREAAAAARLEHELHRDEVRRRVDEPTHRGHRRGVEAERREADERQAVAAQPEPQVIASRMPRNERARTADEQDEREEREHDEHGAREGHRVERLECREGRLLDRVRLPVEEAAADEERDRDQPVGHAASAIGPSSPSLG